METKHNTERLEKVRKVLLFLVPLVYATVMSFSFTNELFPLDDGQELVFIRGMKSKWEIFGPDVFGLFRPIKNIFFQLFASLSVCGVKWCRLVGVVIGIVSFFPVLTLCRRVLGNEWKALFAATVWLLSPTLVSSVAWLSCVNIQIMAAFTALAISTHDSAWDGDSFHSRRIFFSGVFLFLSLVSYENAIAVVPILFLFDYLLRSERRRDKNAWKAYGWYTCIAISYLALRFFNHSSTELAGNFDETTRWQLIVSSPFFVAEHFISWFWPFGRMSVVMCYEWGMVPFWQLAICTCVLAAIGIFALAIWKKSPILCFCILFSFFAVAPVSNCLGLGNGPYCDAYLTLVSIGLSMGCIEAASMLLEVKSSARIVATTIVVAFAVVRLAAIPEAARWAWLWGHGIQAFAESSRTFPNNYSAQIFYAQLLFNQGLHSESDEICKKLEPLFSDKSKWIGGVLVIRTLFALNIEKNAEAALAFLERMPRTATKPDGSEQVHYYRGCIFEDLKNDNATAEHEYEIALSGKWNIDSIPCADRLARLKAMRGDLKEAILLWEKASKLDPNNETVLWNLSTAYRDTGDTDRSDELREQVRKMVEK